MTSHTGLRIGLVVVVVSLAGCTGFLGGDVTQTERPDEAETDATTTVPDSADLMDVRTTAAGGPGDSESACPDTENRQVTDRLQVIRTTATHVTDDDRVSRVELVVTKAPGACVVDLRNVTVQWVDARGTYDVLAAGVEGVSPDGHFGITAIEDSDGSGPVLNAPDDRFKLTFDLAPTASGGPGESFGEELREGDSAVLRIATEDGSVTTVRLTVPESLAGKEAAML